MTNLSINQYLGKKTGDTLSAQTWNDVFGAILTKVNEIVYALNNGGGGSSDEPEDIGTFKVKGANGQYMDIQMHDGVITLPAGTSYTFEGDLVGKVVIDAKTAKPDEDTRILFNSCSISTADDNCALLYDTPENNVGYKGMVITLAKDTQNYVICTKSVAIGDDQPGAIYSTNNLVLQGCGYLAVKNDGGHGIRGTEFKIAGPHICINAVHDGIHGKYLDIDDGAFYFSKCNDCFGISQNGRLCWYCGKILYVPYSITGSGNTITLWSGSVFDLNSSNGGKGYFVPGTSFYVTDNRAAVDHSGFWVNDSYFTSNNFESVLTSPLHMVGGIMVGTQPTISAYASEEAYEADASDTIAYTEASGVRTFPNTAKYIIMSGFDGYANVFEASKVDVVLNGYTCCIGYTETEFSDNTVPCFSYSPSSSRLKITCAKDTINCIYRGSIDSNTTAGRPDAISSGNNLSLEMKAGSHLFIHSTEGDGVDADDVVVTDSKGSLIILNCGERGIKGNAIVIGPDAEAKNQSFTYYTDPTDTETYKTMDGVVVLRNNCVGKTAGLIESGNEADSGYADIYARNSSGSKGIFGTTDAELRGVLITEKIASVAGIDFGNATHLYYGTQYTPQAVNNSNVVTASQSIDNNIVYGIAGSAIDVDTTVPTPVGPGEPTGPSTTGPTT